MTRPLRVALTDFSRGEESDDHFLLAALRTTTPAVFVPPEEAELLLFGVFGDDHTGFVGTKVEFSGENTRPRWDTCDFAIGPDLLEHERYLRFPYFASGAFWDEVRGIQSRATNPWAEREFCLFLVSHATPERRAVFEALSRYRRVTSPGAFLHNEDAQGLDVRKGNWRDTKLDYQRGFRFSVAFENAAHPGYTTEKITDALVSRSIPIYWGNPEIALDVHPDCFINASDFPSLDAMVEHVREVDNDESLAARYLAREDFLVRPPGEYWDELVTFLGAAAATVGTRPESELRARATRLRRGALTRRPAAAAQRLRKGVAFKLRRFRGH